MTSSFLNSGISIAGRHHYIKKEKLGAKNKNVEQKYRVLILLKLDLKLLKDILYIYK